MKNKPVQHKASMREIIITAIVVNILLAVTNHSAQASGVLPEIVSPATVISAPYSVPAAY